MAGSMAEPKDDTGARELQLNVGGVAAQGGARKTHYEHTLDGSVDIRGNPAVKGKSGGWLAGSLLLVNQGLATLAFFGVNVNLVLFLTRVLQQHNADAANNVSKWTGTVYIFSLVGAFLSDSYWGRFKTCAIFQVIFVLGLIMLSFSSQMFLVKPSGCGGHQNPCRPHSNLEIGAFYLSIYMVALGNGGYQPNAASFGADQFDVEDAGEAHSKISFFSYFYLALNLGSLFSNTILSFLEDQGSWSLGFWASTSSAVVALLLFLGGTHRYRHFAPCGNPLSRICQVAVAALRKWRAGLPPGGSDLYEVDDGGKERGGGGCRKMLHTDGFRFLDRAAIVEFEDFAPSSSSSASLRDPWRLCPVTQVEEVKCLLRLLPIWLCTILYSVVFTQMASLFVVQGAAMRTAVGAFSVPPSSMSAFDILSVAAFIFLSRRLIDPVVRHVKNVRHHHPAAGGLTELQRMGVGLVVAVAAMIAAGAVEHFRLKRAAGAPAGSSSLHIMWQVPQYVLVGASEVFMYVGQLEFFNRQAPEGLKSFASALCMTSISFGNFFSDLIVTAVMEATAGGGRQGWIPEDLNRGHLDRFYFLLAALTSVDFVVFVVCAKWYKSSRVEGKDEEPV